MQTNSYMYKNMVRKNVKNNLPYISSKPGSKQGSTRNHQSEKGSIHDSPPNKYNSNDR